MNDMFLSTASGGDTIPAALSESFLENYFSNSFR